MQDRPGTGRPEPDVGGPSLPGGLHPYLVITLVETVDDGRPRRWERRSPVDGLSTADDTPGDGAWTGPRRPRRRPALFTSRPLRVHSGHRAVHRRPQLCPRPVVDRSPDAAG